MSRSGNAEAPLQAVVCIGAPTLVSGAMWAMLLRLPRTLSGTRVRVGWVLSIPLAALNAASAAALSTWPDAAPGKVFWWFVAGGTLGIGLWGPALFFTLVFFGLPISWGQNMAKKGLAGEERGELVVGLAALIVSAVALALMVTHGPDSAFEARSAEWLENSRLAKLTLGALSAAGMALGAAAAFVARARESARRAFVAGVSSGALPGYRVDATDEGKVLLRVYSPGGASYRVADFEEALFALDKHGEARREMT